MRVYADGAVCAMLHDGGQRSLIAVANKTPVGEPELLVLVNNRQAGVFGAYPLSTDEVHVLWTMFGQWLEKHGRDPFDPAALVCAGCGLLSANEPTVGKRPDGAVRCNDCQQKVMGRV